VEADIRISEDVASPVTFGLRKPVVLLPAGFPLLDAPTRDAVLAHECLHVRRHDWAITMAEELVRTVFWFHPAIWWLLGEIQLAREQAVDRAAVEMTSAREEYVDALLALSSAPPRLDLAPAPLFLRRRHLKQRITSLLKEPHMSKEKTIPALAAGLCLLAAACWLVTGVFPLSAAPQTVADAPGVSVDTGGAALLHRTPVPYPETARANGVQGMVMVEATLDSRGNVVNFGTISGPEELRLPVLKSLLNWHFTQASAGKTLQVSVLFQAPPGAAERKQAAAPPPSMSGAESQSITAINVAGLPDSVRNDLLASLPVRAGSTLKGEDLAAVRAAVQRFDEHLTLASVPNPEGVEIRITAPGARPSAPVLSRGSGGVLGGILSSTDAAAASSPQGPRVPVGGNVQMSKIIKMVQPVYPPLAKRARIQGKVILKVVVGQDGAVTSVTLENGHPLLAPAAIDAVRQWTFQPTLLNGQPVDVVSTVEVNFTLPDEAQL
jgi:TonB family protein